MDRERERERDEESNIDIDNSLLDFFDDEDEINVAVVLLELSYLIKAESRPRLSFTWGQKRKRSSLLSVSPPPKNHHGTPVVSPTKFETQVPVTKAKPLSPKTPLLLLPSEIEEKPNNNLIRELDKRTSVATPIRETEALVANFQALNPKPLLMLSPCKPEKAAKKLEKKQSLYRDNLSDALNSSPKRPLAITTSEPEEKSEKLKRKKLLVNRNPQPPSMLSLSLMSALGTCVVIPKHETHDPMANPLSPKKGVTLSPAEHEEESKKSKRKPSLYKKKMDWLNKMDSLTKNNEKLKREIEKEKRYCEEQKVLNLKLKARKQELLGRGPKQEKAFLKTSKGLNLMIKFDKDTAKYSPIFENQEHHQQTTSIVHQQPLITDHMVHKSQFNNHVGPFHIHDLNISPHASIGKDSAQSYALRKAMAAQARYNRIQLCRVKNFGVAYIKK